MLGAQMWNPQEGFRRKEHNKDLHHLYFSPHMWYFSGYQNDKDKMGGA
jgi:hypothetical protein